ncbi:arylesterase [uncultured Paraglaciecola sp.]|uniref:arylesterase n=1 Tax=uncultured Paraglaciecola sp. TaxID=1765024 RepID=UPI00261EA66C|nr:arylesterase [uncultured Paraglaciecola sp.]
MPFLNTYSLRIKIVLLFVVIRLLLIPDQLHAKETKLLILGDSLSAAYGLKQEQGWVSLLQDAWQDQDVNVINAAISGETTDGALARLPRLLEQHQPTHIFVELGGNDGLQGHPISKIRGNLEEIIQLSQKDKVKVILQQMQIPTNYGTRYTKMFTASYTQLAEKHALTLLPFFLENIALDKSLMQRDGIHPTAEAQIIIAKEMQKTLGGVIFP